MASESCPICGDEIDEDEDDPCGHFSSGEAEDGDLCHLLIFGPRRDRIACDRNAPEDAYTGGASTNPRDVNCPACLAIM